MGLEDRPDALLDPAVPRVVPLERLELPDHHDLEHKDDGDLDKEKHGEDADEVVGDALGLYERHVSCGRPGTCSTTPRQKSPPGMSRGVGSGRRARVVGALSCSNFLVPAAGSR